MVIQACIHLISNIVNHSKMPLIVAVAEGRTGVGAVESQQEIQ